MEDRDDIEEIISDYEEILYHLELTPLKPGTRTMFGTEKLVLFDFNHGEDRPIPIAISIVIQEPNCYLSEVITTAHLALWDVSEDEFINTVYFQIEELHDIITVPCTNIPCAPCLSACVTTRGTSPKYYKSFVVDQNGDIRTGVIGYLGLFDAVAESIGLSFYVLIVRADYVIAVEDPGKSISPLEVYKQALWLDKHMCELPTAYAQCAKKRGLRSEDLSFPIYEESSLQDGCNHPNLTNRIGDPRRPVRFLFFRRVPAVYAQGAGCSSILHASFRMFFAA